MLRVAYTLDLRQCVMVIAALSLLSVATGSAGWNGTTSRSTTTIDPSPNSKTMRGGAVASRSLAAPGKPRCVSITQWTSNSILVSWSDSATVSSGNVTHYQLGYGLVPTERYLQVTAPFNACIVDNLDPGKTYVVALRACNEAGCSPNREEDITLSREADGGSRKLSGEQQQQQCAAVRTDQLLEVPMEVRCEPLSSTTVRIWWTDVGASLPIRLAGTSAYYTVRHTPATSRGLFELRPSAGDEQQPSAAGGRRSGNEANSSSTSLIYSGLRPALSYEFAVRKVLLLNQLVVSGTGPGSHVQSAKQSPWSMKVECVTLEAPPSNPPTNLMARQIDVDSVELSWQPCTMPNGRIVNHTVLVCREPCPVNNTAAWQTRTAAMSDDYNGGWLVGMVDALQPGFLYRFRVRERNSVGESPPSEPSPSIYLESDFTPPDDGDTAQYDSTGQYDYSTARNNDADGNADDQLPWRISPTRQTTAASGRKQADKGRKPRPKRPSTDMTRVAVETTTPRGAVVVTTPQEVWYAVVGAVSGAVTIGVVIGLIVFCRRRHNAKLKRLMRERAAKQADADSCCSRSHSLHMQGGANVTHGPHPHSTLSVSLHGSLPPDAAALLYPASSQCNSKTPPATPHCALRRFTLSSSLASPLSASSCVPLLNAANLPGSPYLTSEGENDDPRYDTGKMVESLRYDPSVSMSNTPYRLTGAMTPSSSALGSAPRCGSTVGVGVELRSLSSAADSTGSASNADGQRSARGVPFVSPLHLPRTIGMLNALGASPNDRAPDLPTLPPSQSLFGTVAHPHGALLRDCAPPFGTADLETCTTVGSGTGSNSMASLSSSGFIQRATRSGQHAMVDPTILSPLSKPRSLARPTDESRQGGTIRSNGAATPLSVCSSTSASNSACKSGHMALSPTRSRVAVGITNSMRRGAGGPVLLSPVSGATTIDPGYASSTSTSLAHGGGAPSVDSGCGSNTSRSGGNTHRRDDFQSYKSFSTDELTAEIAHIEGIMKDLSSITQKDFDC